MPGLGCDTGDVGPALQKIAAMKGSFLRSAIQTSLKTAKSQPFGAMIVNGTLF